MQKLKDVFSLIYIILNSIYRILIVSNTRYLPYLEKQIRIIEQQKGIFLEVSYRKRLKTYMKYATGVIGFFQTLRPKRFSRKEDELTSLFFGLIVLFDDLIDEYHYTQEEILNIIQKKPQRNIVLEQLCIGLFERLAALQKDFKWTDTWQKVVEAQIESQLQGTTTKLETSFLERITFEKGGYSLFLWLEILLGKEVSAAELKAFFQLGGAVQLTNDIFDIYKDSQSNIATLATAATDMHQLTNFYNDTIQKTMQLFYESPYPRKNIRFAMLQYLLIATRACVALDQLREVQATTNNVFDLSKYQRKQLICDMELWRNLKKSLQYTLTWINVVK
jgi:hypothetical protein